MPVMYGPTIGVASEDGTKKLVRMTDEDGVDLAEPGNAVTE